VYREREKEREKERKNREKFFFSFFEKKELPPKKIKNKIKKMPWDQDPEIQCPGALVPGIPSKLETVTGY
jgi:hypothetical protein